jgi:hypothetical protein
MKQPEIKHIAIRQIVNGTVIEYGSKCYGTADGSQFLGLLPYAATAEVYELLKQNIPTTLRRTLERISDYSEVMREMNEGAL